VIHRDIKPSNIILDHKSRIRILDFGLAKLAGNAQLTQVGTVVGTVNYMSPEQAQGIEVDHRSDIFSLGVIAFEMLSGTRPFALNNIPATLHAIVNDNPPSLEIEGTGGAGILASIVNKALSKSLNDRFQSAAEFVESLSGAFSDTGTTHTVTGINVKPAVLRPSVAVLYLRNLGSPEDEFLSYGITEDLIVDLSRIGDIKVTPIRTALKYKDSELDLPDIAHELHVSYVLDGSIHREADQIRVSAQLVAARDNETVWAKRWNNSKAELPTVKDALAKGVASTIKETSAPSLPSTTQTSSVAGASAYEHVLRARYLFLHKQDKSDASVALQLYQKAHREDSSLLSALTGQAEILLFQGDDSRALDVLDEAMAASEEVGDTPEKVYVLRLLAQLFVRQSRWDKAWKHASEALSLCLEEENLLLEAEIRGVLISILQPQARHNEILIHFDRILDINRDHQDDEQIAESL